MNQKSAQSKCDDAADAKRQQQVSVTYRNTMAVRTVVVALYSLGIIYFGTRPQMDYIATSVLSHDKLLHALAFGGLGVVAYRCGRVVWPKLADNSVVLASIGFATALGALLEAIQACLPYRTMEFADLVADLVGATLCVVLAKRLGWERPLLRTGT